jgi:glucose/arabinose dehydrogenase/cytochrome c2
MILEAAQDSAERACAGSIALLAILSLAGLSSAVRAADASAGKALFRAQCLICHSAEPDDGGGAQGPLLAGIFGRPAASVASFGYTQALRKSGLTWDDATLRRFLEAPTTVVPGTSMGVAVTNPVDRSNLVAYFKSLPAVHADAPRPPLRVPAATRRTEDWREDAPGRRHQIELAALPAPFATPSANNGPRIIPRPAAAVLEVPDGFHIAAFVRDLRGPRKMLLAANGDILVTETDGGRVSVLHPRPDGASATAEVYASGLHQPYGIAFYPNAARPEWLYVAATDRVVRYRYATGDARPAAPAEVVIADLPTGGHSTRDIAFSADGRRLFLSVGSASNVAEGMSKKSAADLPAWETLYGVGAGWDAETGRAAVLVADLDHPERLRHFANGIRNCVSLTTQPGTGDLWCTTNERDRLGDDLVPDYSTHLVDGGFYGWPWYYLGAHEDPRLKGDRPDLAAKVIVPDLPYQAHSAALNLTFYAASDGVSAFPAEFDGDAFVTFHGSWNRSLRTGYKLVRARIKDGRPLGDYEDFVTGFIADDGNVWGRPVATLELGDGSLLLSDDASNTIWRISYARRPH